MYHDKIDWLLDTYCRKLADNLNARNAIDARVPSVMISGGSNFPVGKKAKQNAARDRNYEEYRNIEGLLDKIRSVGTGGISSDDPQAVEKLEAKLAALEKHQELMKAANSAIRMKDPTKGDAKLAELGYTPEELERPLIGVVSAYSEIVPGHMNLDKIAEAVKAGVKAGDIVKQVSAIAGGSGGGKPDSAMGGGKDVTKVDNALAIVDDYVVSKLK